MARCGRQELACVGLRERSLGEAAAAVEVRRGSE